MCSPPAATNCRATTPSAGSCTAGSRYSSAPCSPCCCPASSRAAVIRDGADMTMIRSLALTLGLLLSGVAAAEGSAPVRVSLDTDRGEILLELYPDKAPHTVRSEERRVGKECR